MGKAIGKAIEPTVTDLTNKAANAIDQAAQNTEQQVARSSGLEGAMANLERSVQGYATEAAKNMKVCRTVTSRLRQIRNSAPNAAHSFPNRRWHRVLSAQAAESRMSSVRNSVRVAEPSSLLPFRRNRCMRMIMLR